MFNAGIKEALASFKKKEKVNKNEVAIRGLGVGMAAPIVASPFQLGLFRAMKENTGDVDVAELQRRMGTKATHVESPMMTARARPEAFGGGKGGTINAPKRNAEIVAHELGHIRNYGSKGRGLMAARMLGPLAGLVGGATMALKGEEGGTATKAAPFVSAAGHMPKLLDEGVASYRGMKALKAMGKLTPAMRNNLLKAFGTYGLGAAASVAPIAYMSYRRGWSVKKPEKKS